MVPLSAATRLRWPQEMRPGSIERPGFLDSVRKISGHMQQNLAMLLAEHPGVIAEIRGRGLLLGLKLHVPAAAFIAKLREIVCWRLEQRRTWRVSFRR